MTVYVVCYFRNVYPFIYSIIAVYLHAYIVFYFVDFKSPNQCSFAVEKVMIKESYYYYCTVVVWESMVGEQL